MKTIAKLTILMLPLLFSVGCASVVMLPKTAVEAPFDTDKEGKVGWSSYMEKASFKNASEDEVYNAAKSGLAHAKFQLLKASKEGGVVIGEHGITWHDWNVIAGVYFRKAKEGYDVLVLAEGSKDIGIAGDQTGGAWTGKILNKMREILEYKKKE
jgi:hypothetical protein